ncbi:hypothetical protein BU17DRAFT_62211 [Hysterangium stoloniferum]|nr:hypothetical protein BU17DRAFT_62211 [Hysterangium stoloniferum]
MSKFRIAVSKYVQIDVYESASEFVEVGAGITLWGRVCEALHILGLAQDCIKASVIVASTSGRTPSPSEGFMLREAREPHRAFGKLPFRGNCDAWSLHRADLLHILLRRVPKSSTHLRKRFVRYEYTSSDHDAPIRVHFADGSTTECDVLLGADGLRSAVRGQIMREAAEDPNKGRKFPYENHIHPRFSGTIAYRILLPAASLAARNPDHPMLKGAQVYMGKSKHVVGYPISPTVLNVAVNVTPGGRPFDSPTTTTSPMNPSIDRSRTLDRKTFAADVIPQFAGWTGHPLQVLESVEAAIEWPIMDLEPPPAYRFGRVAIMGDAAHATVPYLGAGAAAAIELTIKDAFVLSRLFYAAAKLPTSSSSTPCSTLELALTAYDNTRRPYGNRLIGNGRSALRDFQLMGRSGGDIPKAVASIVEVFEDSARVGQAGPNADAVNAVEWMKAQYQEL